MKNVFELEIGGFDIVMRQSESVSSGKRFVVRYGKQVKTGLNYADAAMELGCCIMHALACEGRLDNEGD